MWETTGNGGSLGSLLDEERGEVRKVVWIAGLSDSSNLRTQIAPWSNPRHVCVSVISYRPSQHTHTHTKVRACVRAKGCAGEIESSVKNKTKKARKERDFFSLSESGGKKERTFFFSREEVTHALPLAVNPLNFSPCFFLGEGFFGRHVCEQLLVSRRAWENF